MFVQTIFGEYQVFVQGYSDAPFYVTERASGYFVVKGPAGASFGWEIKAKQAGLEQERMDAFHRREKKEKEAYGKDGARYYQEYMEGLVK